MRPNLLFTATLALTGILFSTVSLSAQSRVDYDYAFIGDPLPDPVMQQNKETFVLYGCAYCHGMYLAPVGEAADLRISPLVASDVDANVIGPILRNGIPQTPKSSPMPQFSDLSEREIKAISAYIHYARAEVRYTNLTTAPHMDGKADAGKTYYEQNCASCHSVQGDLSGSGSTYNPMALRELILKPTRFRSEASYKLDILENAELSAGKARHQVLLENFDEPEFADLVAFLMTLK